jgi:hypothetical protein
MGTSSSTLEFSQGIKNVRSKPCALDDHATWKLVFASEVKPFELYAIVDPKGIRQLRRYSPANLAAVVYKCVDQLHLYANERKQPATKGKTPLSDPTAARMALLLLARLLPFVLEDLLPEAPSEEGASPEQRVHPMAERFAHHLFMESKTFDASGGVFPELVPGECLGHALIDGILAVATAPGFAIGERQTKDYPGTGDNANVEAGQLWCPGIGSNVAAPLHTDSAMTLTNRLYVVRALVSSVTSQAFTAAVHVRDGLRSRLLSVNTPHACTMAASLMNIVTFYSPAGSMPYTAHWVSQMEELVYRAAEFLTLALDSTDFYPADVIQNTRVVANRPKTGDPQQPAPQTTPPRGSSTHHTEDTETVTGRSTEAPPGLSTDERPPAPDDDGAASDDGRMARSPLGAQLSVSRSTDPGARSTASNAGGVAASYTPDLSRHAFYSVYNNMTETEALAVCSGIVRLMNNNVESRNTYLPGSKRTLPGTEYYFALFWVLVEKCPTFRKTLVNQKALVRSLLVALLDFGFFGVRLSVRAPQLQLTVAVMANLSSERGFAIALNHPFQEWVPYDIQAFTGTYADLVFVTLHAIILKRDPWVLPHHNMIMATLRNLSPYVTAISSTTAAKLVTLLDHLSTPTWLTLHPQNPSILRNLVAMLATFIQYQPQGSVSILYSFLRQRETIRQLVKTAHRSDVGLPADYAKSTHVFTLHCAAQAADDEVTDALKYNKDADIVELLKHITLVGRLPVPHPIELVMFPATSASDAWRVSWMWSLVFMFASPPFVDPDSVKIFSLSR